jgi:serine phosphatase RsbU (regulator of sigma subunit)
MRCFLSFIWVLFFPALSWAQTQAQLDSLTALLRNEKDKATRAQLMVRLSSGYIDISPDSSLKWADRALAETEGGALKKERALGFSHKATATGRLGREQESIALYRQALDVLKGGVSPFTEAGICRNLGNAYYHLARYDSALTEYFRSYDLYLAEKDTQLSAGVLNNIGNVYYFNDTKKAREYYQKSLDLYLKLDDKEGLAKQCGNLGLISMKLGDTTQAIGYSELSLKYYQAVGSPFGIATSHVNLGDAYRLGKRMKEAQWHMNESLRIRREINDRKGTAIASLMLGSLHYEIGQFGMARPLLDTAVALTERLGLRNYEMEAKELLARCLLATGDQSRADDLFSELTKMRDSVATADLHSKMAEMDTRYRTLQKDAEINKLNSEAEINALRLRRREYFLAAATVVTLLLSIMAFMAYGAYRGKQRSNVLLETRNREIEQQKLEITDSIRYAKNLQTAVLASDGALRKLLPDPFILFMPRDIVSGDFYWADEVDGRVYFAVVDCTGHGVPGAFVSMVGHNGLNRVVRDLRLTQPAEILERLSAVLTETLNRDEGLTVKDGMDMALCSYDPATMILEYAGAYNPLLIVRNGQEILFKADRQPVGMQEGRKPFSNHRIMLQHNDRIFLYSDGFADQFGGETDKKFGSVRFRKLLVDTSILPMKAQAETLTAQLIEWRGHRDQTDDVTVLGVRI